MDAILDLGLYIRSTKFGSDWGNASEQFVYALYRERDSLGDLEQKWWKKLDDEGFDYDIQYYGFRGGPDKRFNPDQECEAMDKLAEREPEFREDVLAWHNMYLCFEQVDLQLNGAIRATIRHGQQLMGDHDNYKGEPLIALDWDLFWNIFKKRETLSEEQRAHWAMYMGMLSIIGQKPLACTTSDAIKCRMFGAKNQAALDQLLTDEATRQLYDHWTSRRRYERLLSEVEYTFHVKSQGMSRHTYLSYRYADNAKFLEAIIAYSKRKTAGRDERREMLKKMRGKGG